MSFVNMSKQKMIRHVQTTVKHVDGDGNISFKANIEEIRDVLESAGQDKIILITIIGSYQTGKSTTIMKLTRDCEIVIGDGMDETTKGVLIYGPYQYNSLRNSFGLPLIDQDSTKVFFIDTEGICGFSCGDNPEENSILVSQLISPYAALSHIVINLLKPNVTCREIETLKGLFETIFKIRENDTNNENFSIINLYSNMKEYRPGKNFVQCQERVKEIIHQWNDGMENDIYIPLPMYSINDKPLQQSEEFNLGFDIFAKALLEKIDYYRINQNMHVETAIQALNNINNKLMAENLLEFAKLSRYTKYEAAERLYGPEVQTIINEMNKDFQNKKYEIINEIRKNEDIIQPNTSIELPLERYLSRIILLEPVCNEFPGLLEEFSNRVDRIYKKNVLEIEKDQFELLKERQYKHFSLIIDDILNQFINEIFNEEKLSLNSDELIEEIGKFKIRCRNDIYNAMKNLEIYPSVRTAIDVKINESTSISHISDIIREKMENNNFSIGNILRNRYFQVGVIIVAIITMIKLRK